MSIIVVVKKNGRAALAADTAQTDDTLRIAARYVTNHSKILQVGTTYIGLAGWSFAQDILEHLVRKEPGLLHFTDRASIFQSAVDLHRVLKDRYYLDPQEEKDQPVESSQLSALLLTPAGIFELESYRSVIEYERFWALGSGKALALGAMHALYAGNATAEEIAQAGVAAACEFDDGCALPQEIRVLTLQDAAGGHPPAA